MARCMVLVALVAGANAFSPSSRPALGCMQRVANPAMRATEKLPNGWKKVKSMSRPGEFSYLNEATGERYDRLPNKFRGTIYDDEVDTTAKPLWQWNAQEKKAESEYASSMEAAGFMPNGEDLAGAGGVYYIAFIPFLLFFLAYVFGSIGSPYGTTGNFR